MSDVIDKPRTIAWLAQGDEGFGVARAMLSLAGELRRRGHRTHIVCLNDGPFAQQCETLEISVVQLGLGKVPGLPGGVLAKTAGYWRLRQFNRRAAGPLLEALRKVQPDVLHFIWPSFVGLAGRAAASLGIPAFWEMPNVLSDRLPWGINRKWYHLQCRRFGITPLANSAYTAASLGDGLVKPIVFHLGADQQLFDPGQAMPIQRAALGIPDEATVIGIVARLDPSKGQDRVARAISNLVAADLDLHLLLLGGPTGSDYAARLREVCSGRVHLVGTVSDPQRYYGVMDVVINSYISAEAFGLSVVEAMMMGKPVLVHALGGPAETVEHGQTGWHIKSASVEAFEAGIRQALEDRPRWPKMGDAARQRALERFSVANQAERYLQIIEQCLRQ